MPKYDCLSSIKYHLDKVKEKTKSIVDTIDTQSHSYKLTLKGCYLSIFRRVVTLTTENDSFITFNKLYHLTSILISVAPQMI